MRTLNQKIRNDIANSYRLRDLAKDDKLTKDERIKIYKKVAKNDEKILFFKGLSLALKKVEKDEENNKVVKR